MSHFYGTVRGNRKEATRTGSKDSGMVTQCASWAGAVECRAYVDEATGADFVSVSLIPWQGQGSSRELYRGPISGREVGA